MSDALASRWRKVLKLYTNAASPFARKCRVIAHELGLKLEEVRTLPMQEPEFRRVNPLGKIPALVLDDGTRCVLRAGDEWGGRADGLVPAYGCGMTSWSYAVLASPDQDLAAAIDRSQPMWRVQTGNVGPPTAGFWPPLPRKVTTAWFAGNAVG